MVLDSYTVFDVETANSKRESICSIGYIRVENGAILESKEILINPETDFDNFNIKIHGITPQKVAFERTFPEVWEEIKPYFSNTVLVAHNAKSMDLCALTRTLDRYNLEIPSNDYICTYELAKNLYTQEEVGAYKLNVLCYKFDVPLEHHHNALDDAKACYDLLNHFLALLLISLLRHIFQIYIAKSHPALHAELLTMVIKLLQCRNFRRLFQTLLMIVLLLLKKQIRYLIGCIPIRI